MIDTNVVIDYASILIPDQGTAFVENILNTAFNTSVVVKIDVLGYNDVPARMQLLEEFLASATLFPLDDAVTQKTIELRRIKKIKLGDAIIAATALVYNHTLITRNTTDFKNIDGLVTVNLHDLQVFSIYPFNHKKNQQHIFVLLVVVLCYHAALVTARHKKSKSQTHASFLRLLAFRLRGYTCAYWVTRPTQDRVLRLFGYLPLLRQLEPAR